MNNLPTKLFGMRVWRNIVTDCRGNVMLLMGLGITVLVAAAGVGLDIGLQQLTKAKLQQALDASVMAAAMIPPDPNSSTDIANRQNAALNFYKVNFPASFFGIERPEAQVEVQVNTTPQTIAMNVNTSVPMRFLGLVGISQLETTASATVSFASTPPPSQDIFLALDVTGSMHRVDNTVGSFLDPDVCSPLAFTGSLGPDTFSCYGSTSLNALRFSIDTLAIKLLSPNTQNHRMGIISWANGVVGTSLAPTGDYPTVRAHLGQLYAVQQPSNSTTGMIAANTMSDANLRPGAVRAVILVLDGENTNGASANDATKTVCTAMKTAGMVVYTVSYGYAAGKPEIAEFLQDCASGNPANNRGQYFYEAPDSTTLNQAFNDIFASIRKVRVTQ